MREDDDDEAMDTSESLDNQHPHTANGVVPVSYPGDGNNSRVLFTAGSGDDEDEAMETSGPVFHPAWTARQSGGGNINMDEEYFVQQQQQQGRMRSLSHSELTNNEANGRPASGQLPIVDTSGNFTPPGGSSNASRHRTIVKCMSEEAPQSSQLSVPGNRPVPLQRRIYPSFPYSPYGSPHSSPKASPCASPRMPRPPTIESNKIDISNKQVSPGTICCTLYIYVYLTCLLFTTALYPPQTTLRVASCCVKTVSAFIVKQSV